jgi:hypothetical protein
VRPGAAHGHRPLLLARPGDSVRGGQRTQARGANHNKEKALQGIYGVDGLETVADIRRILDLAITGVLPLSDSINRSRVLIQAAGAAARLLETGELEKRVQDIESVVGQRPKPEPKKHSWWQR